MNSTWLPAKNLESEGIRASRQKPRKRGNSRPNLGHDTLLQPDAFQKPVRRVDQDDAQGLLPPAETQGRHQTGIAGAQDGDIVVARIVGHICRIHEQSPSIQDFMDKTRQTPET
jgi:hypothetical protein